MSSLRIEPVQQPETSCTEYSLITEAGEKVAVVTGKAWAQLLMVSPELLAFAKTIASECARCDGDGVISLHFPGIDTVAEFDADDQSCPDCQDVRQLIASAEVQTK